MEFLLCQKNKIYTHIFNNNYFILFWCSKKQKKVNIRPELSVKMNLIF